MLIYQPTSYSQPTCEVKTEDPAVTLLKTPVVWSPQTVKAAVSRLGPQPAQSSKTSPPEPADKTQHQDPGSLPQAPVSQSPVSVKQAPVTRLSERQQTQPSSYVAAELLEDETYTSTVPADISRRVLRGDRRREIKLIPAKPSGRHSEILLVKAEKEVLCPVDQQGVDQRSGNSKIKSVLLPYLQIKSSKDSPAKVSSMAESERPGTPVSPLRSDPSTPGPSHHSSSTSSPASSLSTEAVRHRSRSPRGRGPRTAEQQSSQDNEYRQRYKLQHSNISDHIISIRQDPPPRPHLPYTELDESYHFALSLVPVINRLDRNSRHQAKIEILNILHSLEREQFQPITTPHSPTGLQPHYYSPQMPHPPSAVTGPSMHSCFQSLAQHPQTIKPTGSYTPEPSTSSEQGWEEESTEGPIYADVYEMQI